MLLYTQHYAYLTQNIIALQVQVNKTGQSKVYIQPRSGNYNEINKRDGERKIENVVEGKTVCTSLLNNNFFFTSQKC